MNSSLNLAFKDHHILCMAFLALGFNISILSVVLFLFFLLLKLPSLGGIGINRGYAIFSCIMFYFLIMTFGFGADNMTLDQPLKTFLLLLFFLMCSGYTIQYQTQAMKLKLIGCYVLGIFLNSFIVTSYSYNVDPALYGYGRLISPFTTVEFNSPAISNMMGIAFAYYYYFLLHGESANKRLVSACIVTLTLLSGVFLGGRTFFLIVSLTVVFYLFSNLNYKSVAKLLVGLSILILLSMIVVSMFPDLLNYYEFVQYRFENGIESNRFKHWANGLEHLPLYPLGGFGVDSSIEHTFWFHNIVIDTARVAGWIPLLFFFGSLIYSGKAILYKKSHNHPTLCIWLICTSLLIMFQDVVLEGEYRSLITFYLVSLVVITSKSSSIKKLGEG